MREECAREEIRGRRVMKRPEIIGSRRLPGKREAEQRTQAAGRGELTGNPNREARGLLEAKRPISEITSISQEIWVLAPEDISELTN